MPCAALVIARLGSGCGHEGGHASSESTQDAAGDTVVTGKAMATAPASDAAKAGGAEAPSHRDASKYPDCQPPYDVPDDLARQDQAGADGFVWGTLLALGGGTPRWSSWPSTVDLINCNQALDPAAGSCTDDYRYVPSACAELHEAYPDRMILGEVGTVDDSLFQAGSTKGPTNEASGLSSNPVLAGNGTFLRYAILMSPATEDWIISFGFQVGWHLHALSGSLGFPCPGDDDTHTHSVSDDNPPSTILKLAFMDPRGFDVDDYYTQDLLVHTSASHHSTGKDTCEEKSMALVGMHIMRKTRSQLAWVWGTFEHQNNAPDCTTLPPSSASGGADEASRPSTTCPDTTTVQYNLYPHSCQPNGAPGPCQDCNAVPLPNGVGTCPRAGWCVDRPPAPERGLSRLCRQAAPHDYYAGATSWDATPPNIACKPEAGVWSRYHLISTQWANTPLGELCSENEQAEIFTSDGLAEGKTSPQVSPPGAPPISILGNTTMESYGRSNCMGCHSRSAVDNSNTLTGINGTDFVYFLALEVPAFEARNRVPRGPW